MSAAEPVDLRAVGLAGVAWAAAIATSAAAGLVLVLVLVLALLVLVRRRLLTWRTAAGWLLAAVAASASVLLHTATVTSNPLRQLAEDGAAVRAVIVLRTDPAPAPGRFGSGFSADGDVTVLWARAQRFQLSAPVHVLLPAAGGRVPRGSSIQVSAVVRPSTYPDQTAVVVVRSAVVVVRGPGTLDRIGNRVRSALNTAVSALPPGPRALVPALVDGQKGALTPQQVSDFRTSGLTHLLAVSGTNLTMIVGFVLLLARWCGVRARGLIVVGFLGVGAFLVLAGPEPSVLRAATMGLVALIGLGSGGRQRGVRALGLSVLMLIVLSPGLARSVGFALSVLATAGILLLAPRWRDALRTWLPRWVAELVAVPLAAHVVCTPLIAAISGQVSLVAVAANLMAAPLVAPTTVLGVLAGLVALVSVPLAQVIAIPAGWCASGLITIATRCAELPLPAVGWSTGVLALVVLTAGCVIAAGALQILLIRRGATLLVTALLTVLMVVPLPTPGWPPAGWVMVACSVGQGDGLVLRVTDHAAVVVDAGPDPRAIDSCLQRLEIDTVPAVLLTHFRADHVDGLSGVLHDRRVGQILTSTLADPASGAAAVRRLARAAGVPERAAQPGESVVLGPLRWQVLAPLSASYPDSDSPPNDASLVLLVQVAGLQILLMGDQERPSQADLREHYPHLRADVVKVAHHGSSKQDAQLIAGLGARLAVISVGLGNDYGHPAASTVAMLQRDGMQVRRTDLDGDVAVVDRDGALYSVVRH